MRLRLNSRQTLYSTVTRDLKIPKETVEVRPSQANKKKLTSKIDNNISKSKSLKKNISPDFITTVFTLIEITSSVMCI